MGMDSGMAPDMSVGTTGAGGATGIADASAVTPANPNGLTKEQLQAIAGLLAQSGKSNYPAGVGVLPGVPSQSMVPTQTLQAGQFINRGQ